MTGNTRVCLRRAPLGALCSLLVLTLCLAPGAADDRTNLLVNPGFEEGADAPEGWRTFPPAREGFVYSWDDETCHEGSRSVSVESTRKGFGMWQQVVPVTAGDIYVISGWVRLENGGRGTTGCLQLFFRDANNAVVERHDCPGHSGTLPWTKDFPHDMLVRAPANATKVEVNLFLEGQGKIWFDDVFFGLAPAGDISGTVTSGGQPLEGALAQVWGSPFEDITDADGHYELTGVPVSSPRYIVIASKEGYKKKAQGDLDVQAGETLTVDLQLEPGEDPEALRVKFGALLRRTHTPGRPPSEEGVIDADLYPDAVKVYLEPSECIDSDHPLVVEVAQGILETLSPTDRTSTLKVARAAFDWIIQNVEYDVIYSGKKRAGQPSSASFVDSTEGKWQTITGEGWCWGHNFTDWLYKPSEAIRERRGICIEHGRLAAGLLRALGIPARPVKPYAAQFWVQLPSGEGYWSGMGTSGGRKMFRERGDASRAFGHASPSSVHLLPIDAGPIVHSDWYTENKCLWREVHPWGVGYEDTDEQRAQAVSDLESFAASGNAPRKPRQRGHRGPRPASELEIEYSDFTLDFSQVGEQETLHVRFPLPVETEVVDYLDECAHWTNYADLVTKTWISEETNPPVPETRKWYNIDFDLTGL